MSLPHQHAPRPDTGLYNAKLGTWLFLAAGVMFFGAMGSSYVLLRIAAENWPPPGAGLPRGLGFAQMLAAAATAALTALAWTEAKAERRAMARRLTGLSVAFGVIVLACGAVAFWLLHRAGAHPADSTRMALFFAFAGLLWMHALGGVLALGYTMTARAGGANALECAGLFWQFLAAVWLVNYLLFYVF